MHIQLACLRKERALSQVHQPLIEKGCSDHITTLCAKEWEQQCSGKVLGIASSSPQVYLNCFTSTMKCVSQRFMDGLWKGVWEGFVLLLGTKPATPVHVTQV